MLTILCIDSDLQRLSEIKQDTRPLSPCLNIIEATTLHKAKQLTQQENKNNIALIICAETLTDGKAISLFKLPQCNAIRKILYSTMPSVALLHACINQGHIDYFLEYPYPKKQLTQIIQTQISNYKLSNPQPKQTDKQTNLLEITEFSSPSSFQDRFIDYSLYSDSELSNFVIKYLYKVLEKSDEYNVRRRYSANHLLTHEGEKNNFLWFISKGEVLLKKRNAQGKKQDITVMQAGTIVGGMSFLTGEKAFSTGITTMTTEILKVDNLIFSQIIQSNSALLAPFIHLLLRNFNRRLQHSISTELTLQETLNSLESAHSKLVESEKMAVLGQLIAGVAHELNNPVAAILRGSDTLTPLILDLLSKNHCDEFSSLAYQTLQQGLIINPISTSEVRQRVKKLLPSIKDKKLAKQLVSMNLDNVTIPAEKQLNLQERILLLRQYHQVGTILRNSTTCAKRIADLVKSLKHYAGQDTEKYTAVDIHEGLEETLIIFENKLKNYKVIKEYQELPKVDGYPIKLEQVWTNIIANAIDATEGKGVLRISTINLPYDEIPKIQVIIEDDGPGIPEQTQSKIFELNYTTKREGNFGLGIGLSICDQIIKHHNGTIEIESEPGKFTRFIVTLPVFSAQIIATKLSARI